LWRVQDKQNRKYLKTFPVVRSMNRKTVLAGTSFEDAFLLEYYSRTNLMWLNTIPRGKVRHFVHDKPRQNLRIRPVPVLNSDGKKEKGAVRSLEMLETRPRVFMIENFLSDYEADMIVEHAKTLALNRSLVGGRDGQEHMHRTSRNTWLACTGQNSSDTVNRVCKRSFNLMEYAFNHDDWFMVAESLQLVHYKETQEYQVTSSLV
jgi:hypothetical protein